MPKYLKLKLPLKTDAFRADCQTLDLNLGLISLDSGGILILAVNVNKFFSYLTDNMRI